MRVPAVLEEALPIAFGALRANKARGTLTTLGIVIGIVAVVLTMTAANGLQNRFRESFASVGTDVLYVSRMPWVVMNDFFLYRHRRGITLQQARELESRFRGAAIVNPTVSGASDVKYRDEVMDAVMVIGTTEKQLALSSARPASGRFLMPFDVSRKLDVCVIGADVRKGLFGSTDPLGRTIQVGRTCCRVIGVMEKQGGSFMDGPNFDRQIFVPITSFVRNLGGAPGREDVTIAVKAPRQEALRDLEFAVTGEMRTIRRLRPGVGEDFTVNKLDSLVGTFNSVMGVLFLVGILVTSVSLFVGAVGVMNIMFVIVTERTREIGIRKALGATRRSILLQFLCESSVIGLLGGVIGIALAVMLSAVINATLMPAAISWPIVGIAAAVAAGVGVLAGVAPAWRGARLDPIEALRFE